MPSVSKFKNQIPFYIMVIPAFILVLIYCYVPLYGLIIAFQNYNPSRGFQSPWVGWDNFRFLFNQPNFVRTIWNTFYISIFKIFGGIIVSVFFALLLNEVRNRTTRRTFQTIAYLPNFLSWVIMAGIIIELFGANGIVNQLLNRVNVDTIHFLSNPRVFPWTAIFTDIWKGFGFGTVVYLAALLGIDPALYEASDVDGATRMKQTIYITLPLIMPTIVLMTVLSLGNVLNAGFDQIYNLYSPVVYETGDIIDTYVYRLGIEQAQFAIGTAVGLFKSAISSVLVFLSFYLAYKLAGYRVF